MTDKSLMPVRVNLVEPLPDTGTAMRATDTVAPQGELWSDAVDEVIGARLRPVDVDSSTTRRTRATTRSPRTSPTATATGTTRTTSCASGPSADSPFAAPEDLLEQLVVAWLDCRRSKRQSASAQAFEHNAERNLCALRERLTAGHYQPGRSICFVVTHPKPREVWAASFEDRVVHHLLYNHIGPRFEASFVAGSAACIEGRGTLYAARRLEHDVRSITSNWSRPAWYLKGDLANFFVGIDKHILRAQLHARVTEPWWKHLTDTVLMHDPRTDFELRCDPRLLERVPPHKRLVNAPADTGLPIGNLSSQFFANVHLDALDQFAKHQLRVRYWGRYVDDFYILHESPQWLNGALARITAFLPERLGAQLNPRKTILQPVARGVDFVGQVVRPWRRTTRRRTLQSALTRLERMPADQVQRAGNSYLGLVRQASHGLHEQALICRALLMRGHPVDGAMTKAFARMRKVT
ncbi:MAG: RNA-directed polymerase [Pseudomonadota bacterium]|nr:RNA-directed polymerase [Pseudomonadota bacterium]